MEAIAVFPVGSQTTLGGAVAEITGIDMNILTGVPMLDSRSTAKRMKPLGLS